jgi:hypothetical protein
LVSRGEACFGYGKDETKLLIECCVLECLSALVDLLFNFRELLIFLKFERLERKDEQQLLLCVMLIKPTTVSRSDVALIMMIYDKNKSVCVFLDFSTRQ